MTQKPTISKSVLKLIEKSLMKSLVLRTTWQSIEPQNRTQIHRYKRWDRTLISIHVCCTVMIVSEIAVAPLIK